MKKLLMTTVIILAAIIVLAMLLARPNFIQNQQAATVFVGTTYCGNSVTDAKLLIDKVKGYTNLFVLQSADLQRDFKSVNELGDYAVSAGMYFLPYFGNTVEATFTTWLNEAKQKWGTHLLGVYYGDEPAGKMLDDYVEFKNATTGDSITKTRYADITLQKSDGVIINYRLNVEINYYGPDEAAVYTLYPNGTITTDTSANPNKQLPNSITYDSLMQSKPFKTTNEVAEAFGNLTESKIAFLRNNTRVFTSDYALYWYDYLAGYDVILGQIGWNNTLAQEIGLLRGASKLQNKDWGIVITWKYNQPPYLGSGSEILNQMTTAYKCGAKYFVLFNYYEDQSGPYGTITDEHFMALESFWNNVVKNPQISQGSIKADSVLVLPQNFGGGMRWKEDIIWGIFITDAKAQGLWDSLQTNLSNHSLQLDIVYDDPEFPLTTDYQNVYR